MQQWQSQAAPTPEPPVDAAPAEPAKVEPAVEAAVVEQTPEEKAAVEAAAAFNKPVVVAQRPDSVPEKYWDAEKGVAKADDIKTALDELDALKADRDPNSYAITVTPEAAKELGFEKPEDVFDLEAPLTKLLPGIFAKARVPNEMVPEIMSDIARELGKAQAEIETKLAAEVAKLGENAPARVGAIRDLIVGTLPASEAEALLESLGKSDARALAGFERLFKTRQGLGSPSQGGGGNQVDTSNMSTTQKLAAVYEANAAERAAKGRR